MLARPINKLNPSMLTEVVGEPMQVLVQARHSEARIRAEIFGQMLDDYIVLHSHGKQPNTRLGFLDLRIGDELTVRFLHDGNAYGFVSEVKHLIRVPDELVFLSYPQAIEHVSVRHSRRLSCRLPCNLLTSKGEKAPAVLLDISEGGMKVASRAFGESGHETGTVVTVELTLPDTAGGARELVGEIIRADEQPQAVVAGIKFNDQQADLINLLAEFLYLDGSYSGENDSFLEEGLPQSPSEIE